MNSRLATAVLAATLAAAAGAQDAGPRTTPGVAKEKQELPGERAGSAGKCNDLPSTDDLKKLLKDAPSQGEIGGMANGRYEWAAIVNRSGEVCAVAVSTDDPTQAWPGSQSIALAKAYTANEVHIPVGQPVDLQLVSADVIHSFWAPRLHGKVDLIPGMDNRIRIQADEPGVYHGACAEFCGLQHAHMRFVVVAEEPAAFEAWLDNQRKPAVERPLTAAAQRGKALFNAGPCVLCHTVRGTDARGTVGPDLTHFAKRALIGAAFPQDVATLHAWVTNAPSLKPGTLMPALTQFSGSELQDLVAYLQTLQ